MPEEKFICMNHCGNWQYSSGVCPVGWSVHWVNDTKYVKCPDCCDKDYGKKKKALDIQEGGSHYKCFDIQPIEFITKNGLHFIEGCVIKYVCRHRRKGGAEDIKKAIHYLQLLLELEYQQA